MNPITNIRTGDVLTRPKGDELITHVGVALTSDLVLHNTPEKGEHLGTLQEFADGKPVTVHRTGADPATVVARATTVLANPQKYDPINNNCEHTTTKIVRGVAQSSQVAILGIIALLVCIVVFIAFAIRKQRA